MFCLQKASFIEGQKTENLLLCVVLRGDNGEGWHWRRTRSHLIFEGARVGLGHWAIHPNNWEHGVPLAEFAGPPGWPRC